MPVPHDAKLREQTATITLPEGQGDRYRMRVISAGQGASAFYPAEMLKRDGAAAFPAGTRMKANHDGWFDFGGDVNRLKAKTVTPAEWDEADQALYADFQASAEWSGFLAEFADVIGVSISAAGKIDTEEIDGELVDVCTQLFSAEASPYNSIDFVEAPGANGRIVQALEAAIENAHRLNITETSRLEAELRERKGTSASPPSTEKGIEMDEEQLKALLAEHKRDVLAGVTEALKPAEPKDEKPALSAVAEAVVKAGLSDEGRAAVYEAIERGEGHAAAIERETKREQAIEARVKAQLEAEAPQRGAFHEAGKGNPDWDTELDDVFEAVEKAGKR